MKESKFNLFFKDESKQNFILFNSKTTALAMVSDIEFKMFKNLMSNNFNSSNNEEIKLLNNLKKGGFIIDNDYDEVETFKYLQKVVQFSNESLNLTIAPTLGCNFGCTYCYQGEHNEFKKMDMEIQKQLINFVESRIPKISSFNVTWYGGEPLLAIDIIESLTSKFIELCDENNVNYNASIITNGYHLTKEIATKLNDLRIVTKQITLDGDKSYHDIKRPLKDGSGTFDKILSNLIDVKSILNNISLRINVDKFNKDNVFEIINLLRKNELLGPVIPYLGYIEPTNDFYDKDNCLSRKDFANINDNFVKELSKYIEIDVMNSYPQVKLNSCLADSISGYVIDPEGNLTKCWCDIGFDEFSVGNIKDGITKYNRVIDYSNFDIFSSSKCKDCKIIPICLGGCPRRRLDDIDDHCSIIKYSLEEKINEIVKHKNNSTESLSFHIIN